MTPEEKAVIDAAIEWRDNLGLSGTFLRSGVSPDGDLKGVVDQLIHSRAEALEWVPSTFLYALAGDRIRIGTEETDVLRSSSGAWHGHVSSIMLPSGKLWDKVTPWEHEEVRLELAANPGFIQYPTDGPIEIQMDAERRAVHLLMTVFPGSKRLEVREG